MKKTKLLLVALIFVASVAGVGAAFVARFSFTAPAQISVVSSSYEIALFTGAELSSSFSGVIAFDSIMVGDLSENGVSSESTILFIGLVSPEQLGDSDVVSVKWIGDVDDELPSSLVLTCYKWESGGWVIFAEDSYDVELTKAAPSKGVKFRVISDGGAVEGSYDFKVRIEAAENSG